MKISFVIPVYHNEGALSITHGKIESLFDNELSEYDYEIIFVDDGSQDGSLDELLSLREKHSFIKVITFTRNFGQMSAVLAGLSEAKGDAIVNISADLQDPIDLIPKMIEQWRSGAETVICYRTDRADSYTSKLLSRVAYSILRLSVPDIPSGGFDYVLMDREVVNVFNSIDVRHRFFQGDLLWAGYRTSLIPYERMERPIGKSQYNFWKKLKYFIDAVIDASYLPIRFMSLIGILTSLLGIIYSAVIAISWIFDKTPYPGWAPIMVAILLVGGLIMIMLGVIGEYLWRINEEVRKRPNYLIRKKYE